MISNNKASGAVGGGIIIVGILLLLGGIFLDGDSTNFSSKQDYKEKKEENNIDDSYLFYLNDTTLGKQQKVRQSFPNIELGAKTGYSTIFSEQMVELRSNPFTKSQIPLSVTPPSNKEVEKYLLYASPEVVSGDALLEIYVDDKLQSQRKVSGSSFPIAFQIPDSTNTSQVSISLEKPFFLNLFSWNKVRLNDVKIVEEFREIENKQRSFNFQINRDFLDKAFVEFSISCENKKEVSEPIKATINGYIITNQNPECLSNYNHITSKIPLNVLNAKNNTLTLETEGFYKLSYSINKVYYNDQDVHSFTINSFDDITDVVMYGDFNKEVIDLRLNSQTMTLRRDEIKSIIPYLRFGVNEIEFLTKPVEFEEFIIEKNEFYQVED